MKTTLKTPNKEIETEAEAFAEEVRYAVTHGGKELHPEAGKSLPKKPAVRQPETPWQVD